MEKKRRWGHVGVWVAGLLMLILGGLLLFYAGRVPEPADAVPPVVTAQPGDTVVYRTNTGEKYHRGDCWYLSFSKIELTLDQAQAQGLTPCGVCRP